MEDVPQEDVKRPCAGDLVRGAGERPPVACRVAAGFARATHLGWGERPLVPRRGCKDLAGVRRLEREGLREDDAARRRDVRQRDGERGRRGEEPEGLDFLRS